MALQKEYKYGTIDGDYWKIIGCHSNTLYASTVVRIALYTNKEARDRDEASYLKVLPVALSGIDLTREQAYKMLKERSEFDGAIDC